jgi:predicted SnoaL-like aldol condensation-catalyzing enzyme
VADPLDANKRLVLDLIETAFNQHDPATAAARYLHPDYIQHHPTGRSGSDAFAEHMGSLVSRYPAMMMDVKRVLADGPLVAVHLHWIREPGDPGVAIVDLMRVEDGWIVEHWDVVQEVPVNPPNPLAMF